MHNKNDNNHDDLRERVAKRIYNTIHYDAIEYSKNLDQVRPEARKECRSAADAAIAAIQPVIDAAYKRGVEDGKASMSLDARCRVFGEGMPVEFWPWAEGEWKVSVDTYFGPNGRGETMEAALEAAIAKALEAKGATVES